MECFRSGRQPNVLRACALSVALYLVAGCATFGGRAVQVQLDWKPASAIAFTLDEETWLRSGKPLYDALAHARGTKSEAVARKALLDWLEVYRVRAPKPPVKAAVGSHHQVLIASDGSNLDYVVFDPLASSTVELEVSNHG